MHDASLFVCPGHVNQTPCSTGGFERRTKPGDNTHYSSFKWISEGNEIVIVLLRRLTSMLTSDCM